MNRVLSIAAVLLVCGVPLHSAGAVCAGDCHDDGEVTVDELILGVNIVLGGAMVDQCRSLDSSGDGDVTIDELIGAVNNALGGCAAAGPTPAATSTATPAAPPTPTVTVVPPGISTQLLGTFSGRAVNESTGANKAARIKIEVVGNSVTATDLNGNIFASSASITMMVPSPIVVTSTRTIGGSPSASIEIFQLAVLPISNGTIGGIYSYTPLSNPLDMSKTVALSLTRES